jgi:putative DNA primase/helicase
MKVDFDKIREAAYGRWISIFRSLGIAVDETGKHGPCPACSPGDKKSDRFRVDKNVAEKGTYFCSQCQPGDGFSLIMKVMGVDITGAMESVAGVVGGCEKDPIPNESVMTPDVMRSIFNGSKLITKGDPAYRYLTGRRLKNIPAKLRYHPACWEPETKQNQKAMLAVFMGSDNTAVTMHRTFIDADGNKLDVKKCKKILPCLAHKKMNGGAVQLFPLDSKRVLGIAEGIETAIAAHERFGVPVWAATNAGMMECFEPPKKLNELLIFGDNDQNYTGQKAAYVLANRSVIQFKIPVVRVHIPDNEGDWLDVLVNKQGENNG